MARVCTFLDVPRPPRGYWAKQAVGKAPVQEPLPEARPGNPLVWSRDEALLAPPRPQAPRPERRPAKAITLKVGTHDLLCDAKRHFDASRPTRDDGYLRPFKKLLVDIATSTACLDQALALANELLNAFEAAGHHVVIAPSNGHLRRVEIDEREKPSSKRNSYYHRGLWSPDRPTVVYVGIVAIGLAIVEMSESVLLRYAQGQYIREADYKPPKPSRYQADHAWTTTRYMPSGRFRIIAYSPYWRAPWTTDWRQDKAISLTAKSPEIVKVLEKAAAPLVRMIEEGERQAEIEHKKFEADQEAYRRKENKRRIEQSFRESREQLTQIIQHWSGVIAIEQFLKGVEQRATEMPTDKQSDVLGRLQLAREFLGTQDPLAFFLSWKIPVERYLPIYGEHASSEKDRPLP